MDLAAGFALRDAEQRIFVGELGVQCPPGAQPAPPRLALPDETMRVPYNPPYTGTLPHAVVNHGAKIIVLVDSS